MNRIRISSSIANFSDNLRKRYSDYGDFKWFSKDPTIFFGMYHIGDFVRWITHRGKKSVFFCGSDILSLPKWMVRFIKGHTKYCENTVESVKLREMGLRNEVHPMLFDDPEKYQETYKPAEKPRIYYSFHEGREKEYGMHKIVELAEACPEVEFMGFSGLSKEEFDEITADFQGCIRLNEFDGFAETLAKAMLRGQYAFSVIPYEGIEPVEVERIKALADKKEPNPASAYWREVLSKRVEI